MRSTCRGIRRRNSRSTEFGGAMGMTRSMGKFRRMTGSVCLRNFGKREKVDGQNSGGMLGDGTPGRKREWQEHPVDWTPKGRRADGSMSAELENGEFSRGQVFWVKMEGEVWGIVEERNCARAGMGVGEGAKVVGGGGGGIME